MHKHIPEKLNGGMKPRCICGWKYSAFCNIPAAIRYFRWHLEDVEEGLV